MYLLRRITSSGRFIPEIDGFRFLAIALVVMFHFDGIYPGQSGKFFTAIAQRGLYGVQLFFTISGFILALPFASQYLTGKNPVSLRKYFLRRLTRLEPPYILSILAVFAFGLLVSGKLSLEKDGGHLLASIFYLHSLVYGARELHQHRCLVAGSGDSILLPCPSVSESIHVETPPSSAHYSNGCLWRDAGVRNSCAREGYAKSDLANTVLPRRFSSCGYIHHRLERATLESMALGFRSCVGTSVAIRKHAHQSDIEAGASLLHAFSLFGDLPKSHRRFSLSVVASHKLGRDVLHNLPLP